MPMHRAPDMFTQFNIPQSLRDAFAEHFMRATRYWHHDDPAAVKLMQESTGAIFVRGVERLLARGGNLAALMVRDWVGDDDVYDAIAQLGLWDEERYG